MADPGTLPIMRAACRRAGGQFQPNQVASSCSSQVMAGAPAVSRTPGMSGKVISARVVLVEEAEPERAVVSHQLLDGWGVQRGDPPICLIEDELHGKTGCLHDA